MIENFQPLKERLQSEGYVFHSATDTEVIAHLIASCLENELAATAVPARHGGRRLRSRWSPRCRRRWRKLQGTYGLAILFRDWPDVLIAARLGSPLVVGVGDGEHFVASDASPLAGYTDKIVYLADHELAVVTADSLRVIHRDQGHVQPQRPRARTSRPATSPWAAIAHYMLKEIFEQPESIAERHARPARPATRPRPSSAA